MTPLRNHNLTQRLVPPFYKTLFTLRKPGRNTAPPVSSHNTQRSLVSIASLIHHAQTITPMLHLPQVRRPSRRRSIRRDLIFCSTFLSRKKWKDSPKQNPDCHQHNKQSPFVSLISSDTGQTEHRSPAHRKADKR